MSDIAIRVEGLSKQYRIGGKRERYKTLRETIIDVAAAPARRASRLLRGEASGAAKLDETIWALKDVSLEVKRGEVVGIIGRNGAGKSTLLKILSRITEPTEGRVELRGRVGSLLEVGTGFHPELTGRENIYLNGAILGMRRAEIEKKFDEIVAFSEIERFLDTPVKHYSSGMYVRLAFAVAAHLEPEILLVDEVLAVGDAGFQKKCLGKMDEVATEGRTVLFVSHNLVALRSLCPKAVWLDRGAVRGEGPSSSVVSDYLDMKPEAVHEQRWDDPATAPGNGKVRLRRVWAEQEDAMAGAEMARERPISLGVEYWHLDSRSDIHVTLHVYVEQQVVAFTTASSQDPSWQPAARQKGLVRSVCQIPGHFLNTGTHRVKLLLVENRSRAICTLEGALSFEVVETAGRATGWYGKEPGVLRPRLPWRTQLLDVRAPTVLKTPTGGAGRRP